jgi:CDP-diacylglycerol--serine O-phosphatidyltransferase
VVLFFALLIAYPWEVLTIGTLAYLASLPFGWLSHREYVRRDAEAAAQGKSATPEDKPAERAAEKPADVPAPPPGNPAVVPFERGSERPTRR